MNRNTLLRHIIALLFLSIVFFDAHFLAAQSIFSGTISDAVSGESLPAANIQIEGTFQGTITNAEGTFTLQVNTFPATLVVRYIGYETRRLEVTATSPKELEIALQPAVYELEEVVVTDQNAAVAIMRRVIERKQEWRKALDAYEAEAYTRFTLENDTGIVSIIESVTDVFWEQERGMREIVKAQRKTSNMELDEVLPAARFMANMYDDDIDIAGYTFIGVTHPDAIKQYIFEIAGYRYIDDQLIYDIAVKPKNKFKTGFNGQVSVLADEYALIEVSLEPGESFLFPPPMQGIEIVFDQQFSSFGGDFWLPVDFRSQMEIDIGLGRLLTFPTVYIEQVSRMADYKVNAALPDSLFESERSVTVDSVAVADSTALEKSGLAVPLAKAEIAAYETIDSTMTLEKAYEPEGPLARMVAVRTDEEGESSEGRSGRRSRSFTMPWGLKTTSTLRFNRVEGLYSETGLRKSFDRTLELRGSVGYSFALSGEPRWSYETGGVARVGSKNRFSLDVSYARYTDAQTPADDLMHTLNGLVTLLGGRDYYDYYRTERFHSTLAWRSRPLDSRLTLGVQLEEHTSLERQTNYDIWGSVDVRRPNPGVEDGLHRSFIAHLLIGDDESNAGFTGRKSLEVFVEHSDPGLMASDFSYTSYRAILNWRFNTFFKRRLLPNTLDVQLRGFTGSGDVPFQRLGAIDGNMELFSPFGTLKTRGLGPYRGDRQFAAFWEHNFKTIPFELLGLDGMAEQALNIIVFGGHGYTAFPDRLLPQVLSEGSPYALDDDTWHHEIGVSLSGVFSLFRIDFARRLDDNGYYIGIGTARIF